MPSPPQPPLKIMLELPLMETQWLVLYRQPPLLQKIRSVRCFTSCTLSRSNPLLSATTTSTTSSDSTYILHCTPSTFDLNVQFLFAYAVAIYRTTRALWIRPLTSLRVPCHSLIPYYNCHFTNALRILQEEGLQALPLKI
jgi:hypothetical protein